jgi:hypothetical protein
MGFSKQPDCAPKRGAPATGDIISQQLAESGSCMVLAISVESASCPALQRKKKCGQTAEIAETAGKHIESSPRSPRALR